MNKAMYLIVRNDYSFNKEELMKIGFNLVFNYLNGIKLIKLIDSFTIF